MLALGTSPASAHANLIATDPAEGAVLESAPDRIGFTFSESVLGVANGVKVFDAQGGPVAASSSASGSELSVTLDDKVADGTLVVVWRVLSADGHPISGSLSFSVGEASADVALPPANATGTTDVPWTLTLVRGVGYIGLFLAVGLVAFMVLFLRSTSLASQVWRRLVVTSRFGGGAAALAWVAGLPLTAVYQSGGDLGSLATSDTWSVLSLTEYAVAVAVVVGVGLAVGLLGRGQPDRPRGRMALLASAIAIAAPALTGHTRAAKPELLAVAADMLHLVAGSIWLGGLVGLALVLPGLAGRGDAAGEVLARFSAAAAGVLALLVATGVVLTWRIVGSWSGLVNTGYGRLLLIKIAMATIAGLIAAWNRYALLPRLQQASKEHDRRGAGRLMTRSTSVEAGVLVAILLVTGLLVDKSPGRNMSSSASAGPQSAMLGDAKVVAEMSPLRVGPNTVTIKLLDSDGAPTEFAEPPRARLMSDQVDLGAVPVTSGEPGTYAADVVLPAAGTWRLQVSLRTGAFDNPVVSLTFVVGAS